MALNFPHNTCNLNVLFCKIIDNKLEFNLVYKVTWNKSASRIAEHILLNIYNLLISNKIKIAYITPYIYIEKAKENKEEIEKPIRHWHKKEGKKGINLLV